MHETSQDVMHACFPLMFQATWLLHFTLASPPIAGPKVHTSALSTILLFSGL